MVDAYILEISQYGRIVKVERFGSLDLARAIAKEWRDKGYFTRVTDDHNASYPP